MRKIAFQKMDKLNFNANEAFKTLRTNILFSGREIKVMTVTCSTPNEGKTSVSFQLADSFAATNRKVLFVDADIRKSVMADRYKAEGSRLGLTHYLTGQKNMEEVINQTNINNMDIILAGPASSNPTELLEGALFKKLIEEQRSNYDYIIIDAPPLYSVIDAAIIARCTDGVILVVESGAISYKILQKVKCQLEKSRCRILGVVLNKMKTKDISYYGSYSEKH